MVDDLLRTLSLIWRTVRYGGSVTSQKLRGGARAYGRGLKLLVILTVFAPLIFLVAGIWFDSMSLMAIAGLVWAGALILLLTYAAPLGLALAAATDIDVPVVRSYLGFARRLLLIGLSISLFASLVPIRDNLDKLPVLLLAAVILLLLDAWTNPRLWLVPLLWVILAGTTASFVFPQRARELIEMIRGWDRVEPQPAPVTCDDLLAEQIRFFAADSSPLFWFDQSDRRIEWFDAPGPHPRYQRELQAVTPEIVRAEEDRCRGERERRELEEAAARERARERAEADERRRDAERQAEIEAEEERQAGRRQAAEDAAAREEAQRAQRARDEAAAAERESLAFAQLVQEASEGSRWAPRDLWRELVEGTQVSLSYTPNSRARAAQIVARLRRLGAQVTVRKVSTVAPDVANDVLYPQASLEVAQAIQAAVVDYVSLRITAVPAASIISISLP